MIVQAVIDNLSRCFGAPGHFVHTSASTAGAEGRPRTSTTTGGGAEAATGSTSEASGHARGAAAKSSTYGRPLHESEILDVRRRQGRALGLELHDREWDALFNDSRYLHQRFVNKDVVGSAGAQDGDGDVRQQPPDDRASGQEQTSCSTPTSGRQRKTAMAAAAAASVKRSPHRGINSHMRGAAAAGVATSLGSGKKNLDLEIGYAEVLAKAREKARPAMHNTPQKGMRKDDIFRLSPDTQDNATQSFASKLLNAGGSCFSSSDVNLNPHPKPNGSNNVGTNRRRSGRRSRSRIADDDKSRCDETLDTTQDSVAPSLYMNNSPPGHAAMPLYNQYKVAREEGFLNDVINSDSHSSVHMKTFDDTAKQLFEAADGEDAMMVCESDGKGNATDGNFRQKLLVTADNVAPSLTVSTTASQHTSSRSLSPRSHRERGEI